MLPSPTWPKAIGRMPGSLSLDPGGGADDELGDPADRHRDIVLDRARIELRLDDRLADPPELLGLRAALGDDPVGDQPSLERCCEQPLQQLAEAALGLARRHLEQDVPGMGRRQRVDRPGDVGQRQIERRRAGSARRRSAGRRWRRGHGRRAPSRPRPWRAPRNAVSTSRGFGNSFSVAAVMTPSVPSPPMKSCFRS